MMKEITNKELPTIEPDGILLIDKPSGMTSHDVVGRVRRLLGTRKVGHTGTLDPMATGVLVMLVGRAAKAAEYLSHNEKSYEATMRLGITTTTEDITGTICNTVPIDSLPSPEDLYEILPRFTGHIKQVPPMYSALKVGGRKLCDIARKGGTVEREARDVEIKHLHVSPATPPSDYLLSVTCSGGTYIRTLCADIGQALGCGGVMATLRRTEACGFPLQDCYSLEALADMELQDRLSCLRSTEELFSHLPAFSPTPFYYTLCRNGCEIYQHRMGTDFALGERIRLCDPDGNFFALGEVQVFEEGTAIKAIKLFVL